MLSLSWNILAERCLLRNSTPFPIDFERVGRGNEAVNGSKSSSNTKFPFNVPSTNSSLTLRNSEGVNSSRPRASTLTLIYSQTPGLGRTARVIHGGTTITSCICLKTSPKGPSASF
uniref:Uncharacterized protein n=1 Tax=Opuntia streptacantha TaxID=393608 RepID=A0A7C8YZ34_OPUST